MILLCQISPTSTSAKLKMLDDFGVDAGFAVTFAPRLKSRQRKSKSLSPRANAGRAGRQFATGTPPIAHAPEVTEFVAVTSAPNSRNGWNGATARSSGPGEGGPSASTAPRASVSSANGGGTTTDLLRRMVGLRKAQASATGLDPVRAELTPPPGKTSGPVAVAPRARSQRHAQVGTASDRGGGGGSQAEAQDREARKESKVAARGLELERCWGMLTRPEINRQYVSRSNSPETARRSHC